MDRKLILISNDDGYQAKGINSLVSMLRHEYDIIVVAPDGPRSGEAMCMTSKAPVEIRLVSQEEGLVVYSCSGTPVDCVKIGLFDLCSRRPDLILGGINHGDNSGLNAHYSGTMGIVLEGCMKFIPSIGFSLDDFSLDADFTPLGDYVRKICSMVLERGLEDGTCLNVNFPKTAPYKGVRFGRQEKGIWTKEWRKIEGDSVVSRYCLTGDYVSLEDDEMTDRWALRNGYVSITPTTIDISRMDIAERFKDYVV